MKKYGLIGKTLGHSFSKSFFTNYFDENKIPAEYSNYELSSIQDLKSIEDDADGFNVTIPYKESIIPFLDELSPEAKAIGAVNVVEFQNGTKVGHNTDAFGFHQSIKPFLSNKHERAMILGTGGAAKAVAYVLRKIGLDIIYISRSPKGENHFGYDEVNEHMLNACKMIVNTTPIGTFPNVDDCLDLPFKFLSEDHFVVDLIYNPEKTQLLKKAEKQGAMILNGESMLKQQALKSYQIWTQDV